MTDKPDQVIFKRCSDKMHKKTLQEMFIRHRNHLAPVLPSGNSDRLVTWGCNQQIVLGKWPTASQRSLCPTEEWIYQQAIQQELQDKSRVAIYANLKICIFLNRMIKPSLRLMAWTKNWPLRPGSALPQEKHPQADTHQGQFFPFSLVGKCLMEKKKNHFHFNKFTFIWFICVTACHRWFSIN